MSILKKALQTGLIVGILSLSCLTAFAEEVTLADSDPVEEVNYSIYLPLDDEIFYVWEGSHYVGTEEDEDGNQYAHLEYVEDAQVTLDVDTYNIV